MRAATEEPVLVFFDGVCNLCNSTVDFLVRADRGRRLRYAPLQGTTAEKVLNDLNAAELRAELGTIVCVRAGRPFTRSNAILEIASALGGPWRAAAAVARLVPRPLRDLAYAWVAKNRYRWFGQKETCRIPTPEERALFLD